MLVHWNGVVQSRLANDQLDASGDELVGSTIGLPLDGAKFWNGGKARPKKRLLDSKNDNESDFS
jgi:hypothetical protein